MIGSYGFKSEFYSLTEMPTDFQKAIDTTLIELTNTYCFLDDILIMSCGTLKKYMARVGKFL